MTTEDAKNIVELFAFLAAGCFFAFKWVTGYFVNNLSLTLSTRRVRHDDTFHILVVEVSIDKGEHGSFNLHEVTALVEGLPDGPRRVAFPDTKRYADAPASAEHPHGLRQINYTARHPRRPCMRMAPGMKTHYATYVVVPRDSICRVEVTILGRKSRSPIMGEFKASTISLPTDGQESEEAQTTPTVQ